MRRQHHSAATSLALALAMSSLSACAFSDGNPWGTTQFGAVVSFDVTERLNAQGQIRTSNDYLITLDSFDIAVLDVAIQATGSSESGSSTFDPADPPAGYSLCHNGHCHHDDGRLVDYADIEAELASGTGGSATERISAVVGDGIEVAPTVAIPTNNNEPVQLVLANCTVGDETDDSCELEFGSIVSAEATVTSVHVAGTVVDLRTGDSARLPEAGHNFDIALSTPFVASTTLDLPVDKDSPATYRLHVELALPASLLDGIDWPSVPETPVSDSEDEPALPGVDLALATLTESLLADTRLTVTVD